MGLARSFARRWRAVDRRGAASRRGSSIASKGRERRDALRFEPSQERLSRRDTPDDVGTEHPTEERQETLELLPILAPHGERMIVSSEPSRRFRDLKRRNGGGGRRFVRGGWGGGLRLVSARRDGAFSPVRGIFVAASCGPVGLRKKKGGLSAALLVSASLRRYGVVNGGSGGNGFGAGGAAGWVGRLA